MIRETIEYITSSNYLVGRVLSANSHVSALYRNVSKLYVDFPEAIYLPEHCAIHANAGTLLSCVTTRCDTKHGINITTVRHPTRYFFASTHLFGLRDELRGKTDYQEIMDIIGDLENAYSRSCNNDGSDSFLFFMVTEAEHVLPVYHGLVFNNDTYDRSQFVNTVFFTNYDEACRFKMFMTVRQSELGY